MASYPCPLCRSPLSRAVYERVLRVSEARAAVQKRYEASLTRQLQALEQERERIGAKAAKRERDRSARQMASLTRRFANEIRDLKAEHRANQQRVENLQRRKDAAARKDAEAARKHSRKLIAEIEALRKELRAERARAERLADRRAEQAKEGAEDRLQGQIDRLQAALKIEEDRRRRDADAAKRTVESLQQKLDARDQTHLGPEGEEQLVSALKAAFPRDHIERRGKGGDVIHVVLERGQAYGKIVYECKKTARWSGSFVRQLKRALDLHSTSYGLLVTRALPPTGRGGFCLVSRVPVVAPHLAVHVVGMLRESIVALAQAQLSERGKAAKSAQLFDYMRSDEFRNAILRIDDKIKELHESLSREKSHHAGLWRTREQSYDAILRYSSGIESRVREIMSGRIRGRVRQRRMVPVIPVVPRLRASAS